MEHRWGQRVRLDVPIRIKGKTLDWVSGRLIDLSVSGAFIEVDIDIRILCNIQISMILPHQLSPTVTPLDSHVIRKKLLGIGIEWAAFAPATYRAFLSMASQWQDEQCRRTNSLAMWVGAARAEQMTATPQKITDRHRRPRIRQLETSNCGTDRRVLPRNVALDCL